MAGAHTTRYAPHAEISVRIPEYPLLFHVSLISNNLYPARIAHLPNVVVIVPMMFCDADTFELNAS